MLEIIDQISKSFYLPLAGVIITFVLFFYFAAKLFESSAEEACEPVLEPHTAENNDGLEVGAYDLTADRTYLTQSQQKKGVPLQSEPINLVKENTTAQAAPAENTERAAVPVAAAEENDIVVLKRMETSITALENYDQTINNTKNSIKNIDITISNIRKRLENMKTTAVQSSNPNPKMAQVITELDAILCELKESGDGAVSDVLPKLNHVTRELLNCQKQHPHNHKHH